MIHQYIKGRVYVFIDAANLENSAKSLQWWVDYRKLNQYLRSEGNVESIRHYCPSLDDERQQKFFSVLKHIGFELITKPLKIITVNKLAGSKLRKANFDVEITLDAHVLIDNYDTIILFSGDSDFDYLIRFLRRKMKQVIIISSRHHVSRELLKSCHKYIELNHLRKFIERTDKH